MFKKKEWVQRYLSVSNREKVIYVTQEQAVSVVGSSTTLAAESHSNFFPKQTSQLSLSSASLPITTGQSVGGSSASFGYTIEPPQPIVSEKIVGFVTLSNILDQLTLVRPFELEEKTKDTGDYTSLRPYYKKLFGRNQS